MTDSIHPSSIVAKSAKRSALQISTIGLCGLFLYMLHNCYQYMTEGVGYFFSWIYSLSSWQAGFVVAPLLYVSLFVANFAFSSWVNKLNEAHKPWPRLPTRHKGS